MSVSLATKLRWFDQGAAAFSRTFPDALARLWPDAPPHYVCPTCPAPDDTNYIIRLFSRAAVQSHELTAEHVPPRAFGGRELVLTCQPCNNDIGGSQLEAHARRCENPIDVLRGISKNPSKVRLTAGDHCVSAKLSVEEKMFKFTLPPQRKHANDPKEVEAFQKALLKSPTFNIDFNGDRHSPRRANVTWLRHAYLALFAVAGYRYIFSAGLDIVRQQINEPEAEHIAVFLATLPEEHPWSECRIINVRGPKWLQCWAVQIGRYVAFLPKAGDIEFYARLAEDRSVNQQSQFTGDVFEWPTEPSFGLEQPVRYGRVESG